MKKYLREYIYTNFKNIVMIFTFIIIGIAMGIIIFNTSEEVVKNEIVQNAKNIIDISKNQNFEGINIIINSISLNFIMITIIYFAAVTLIPRVIINIISMLRGISIGLYIPVLFSIFGIGNGFIALIILIIIPNIINISSYIYLCSNAIIFNKKIIDEGFKISVFLYEITKIIIAFSLILLSVILEQVGVIIIIGNFA